MSLALPRLRGTEHLALLRGTPHLSDAIDLNTAYLSTGVRAVWGQNLLGRLLQSLCQGLGFGPRGGTQRLLQVDCLHGCGRVHGVCGLRLVHVNSISGLAAEYELHVLNTQCHTSTPIRIPRADFFNLEFVKPKESRDA